MKVLVTGYPGQVANALERRAAPRGHAFVAGAPQTAADYLDATKTILESAQPDAVIHAAAYTAVDAAEGDRDAAFAANAELAGALARVCDEWSLPLVHVSTDYVFDGASRRPYREDDPIAPLGVYGASKAAGEAAVRDACADALIVRTSWVFSRDRPSFVRTMVELAKTRPQLRVVDDQSGCPTFADDLADALLALAERSLAGAAVDGIYHACNAGAVTWCGFARAIVDEARRVAPGAIACTEVAAITTADYPTAARRPAYSVLDTSRLRELGIALPSWEPGMRAAVRDLLGEAAR